MINEPRTRMYVYTSEDTDLCDKIKNVATAQALEIKDDLANTSRSTHMRYESGPFARGCDSCGSIAVYTCMFRYILKDRHHLCWPHVRQCWELQSRILTYAILHQRLKLIGPKYDIRETNTVAVECVMCCQYRKIVYRQRYTDNNICEQCKQRELTIHVELLWFLSTLIVNVDVRVFIMKIIRAI